MIQDARSIRVSAYVEMSIAIKLNSLAEKEQKSISDLIREILVEKLEGSEGVKENETDVCR